MEQRQDDLPSHAPRHPPPSPSPPPAHPHHLPCHPPDSRRSGDVVDSDDDDTRVSGEVNRVRFFRSPCTPQCSPRDCVLAEDWPLSPHCDPHCSPNSDPHCFPHCSPNSDPHCSPHSDPHCSTGRLEDTSGGRGHVSQELCSDDEVCEPEGCSAGHVQVTGCPGGLCSDDDVETEECSAGHVQAEGCPGGLCSDDDVETEECSTGHVQAEGCPDLRGWKSLPAILLEDIFAMLTPKQRHQASMVCQPWYDTFYSPRVWETFVLRERTLTKRRFNLYKGYQRELCPRKTQLCLMRVGCYFKRIVVTAISDYYNLYEFLRVLSSFLSFYPSFPMPLLSTFRFTFACESRGVNGTIIIGTGGNILSKLKELVANMQQLQHLALNELLLEEVEVEGLLAAAASSSAESLHYLELLNCSKVPVPVCEVTQFTQLLTLKVSPQHLNEEVILLLGGTQLLHLHLVQDAYTCPCLPVTPEAWKLFRQMAPSKRVFLEVEGRTTTPLLLQPHAPVRGVVFRTPYHRLHAQLVTWLVEFYSQTLEYVVQERLPRAHGSRRFQERADQGLLRLVRACPRLHTLVVRERLSLATMLLLPREGPALTSLTLRRNALLKRCEWPRAAGWSEDFHRWLRVTGRDYDLAFSHMPVLMRQAWKPLPDRVFKDLAVHVT
ncbi:uncharacterized protein LOC143294985 [Babylonia areolata]|uniref:uncharacterized protein LOC143294985 n=1 Tax=Babylonia areolata TaxID=304850 RepID=UPI003FD57B14